MIGIHVLPKQRDFPRTGGDQQPRFCDDIGRGARIFRTARIGHDTERAEPVATFLDRKKRRRALRRDIGQEIELGLGRKFGVDNTAARAPAFIRFTRRAGNHFRQAVIGLGAENKIDIRCAAHHFRTFRLGDAARDADHHRRSGRRAIPFQQPQPPEFGIHFFRRLFANVAGIEDNQIRVFRRVHGAIAERCEHIRHPDGIVHVHLTAVVPDVKCFCQKGLPGSVLQSRSKSVCFRSGALPGLQSVRPRAVAQPLVAAQFSQTSTGRRSVNKCLGAGRVGRESGHTGARTVMGMPAAGCRDGRHSPPRRPLRQPRNSVRPGLCGIRTP